ncbi:MAG TPA: hypothetical protein EYM86_03595, partial [Flavobacteriales bacterium]|nr:hypothetical protein [Flavobacteriales bacterium]
CLYYDVFNICGGTCFEDLDEDGVCDDIDDCIGQYDYCGVCNGTTCDFYCGDDVPHGNIDYRTIGINGQCWFSENCRYLPEVSPSSEQSNSLPIYYVYGYEGTDVSAAIATVNYDIYGVLYNFTAMISNDVCPDGWHVPSSSEFSSLVNSLGGFVGSGYKMKATTGWNLNGNGSNESGFEAYPGGAMSSSYNVFHNLGTYANFWTSSGSTSMGTFRNLLNYTDNCSESSVSRSTGMSVRCIKDN